MKMRQRSWLYKWLGIGIGVLLLTAASYSQDSEGKFFLMKFHEVPVFLLLINWIYMMISVFSKTHKFCFISWRAAHIHRHSPDVLKRRQHDYAAIWDNQWSITCILREEEENQRMFCFQLSQKKISKMAYNVREMLIVDVNNYWKVAVSNSEMLL